MLDLPPRRMRPGETPGLAHYLLAAAFHGRPIAVCYDAFETRLQESVRALAADLSPDAIDRLYAMGFCTAMVHDEVATPAQRAKIASALADPTRFAPIAEAGPHRAVRMLPPPG